MNLVENLAICVISKYSILELYYDISNAEYKFPELEVLRFI